MMPYNPVDPANLEGEDLTNWYLRSPQEIEQQRQASAQQRYQDFFYGDGADRRTANVATPSQTSSLARPVVDSGTYGGRAPVLQQASYVAPAGAADGPSCATCHGAPPPPIPVPHLPPFPSGWDAAFPTLPVLRDIIGGGGGSSKPPEHDRKQCEIQQRRDGEICARQPTSRANAVCRGTAMDRYSHCLDTGEVDTPRLFTNPGYSR
jgi:hypothetical protein